MRGYYSDKIEITWQGLDFAEGLAQGSFLTPARTSPSFSQKTQLRGKVIRQYSADRSGTVTITVNQSSNLHRVLIEKFQEDMNNRNVVGPMVVKNVASGQQTTFVNAYIQSQPDEPFAMEESDIPWVFGFESVTYTAGIANLNVVGS